MAKLRAIWQARLLSLYRYPQRHLSEALVGSGFWRLFALCTVPIWLTPRLYDRHLRSADTPPGRSALRIAAASWLFLMTLLAVPILPLAETAIKHLGARMGYRDDLFSGSAATALLTGIYWLIFLMLASLQWALVRIAYFLDRAFAFGGRPIAPPPFGYFTVKTAGGMTLAAAAMAALLLLARPASAPLRHWIEGATVVKPILALCLALILLVSAFLKTDTDRMSAHEIYGSRYKAAAYPGGLCLLLLVVVFIVTRR